MGHLMLFRTRSMSSAGLRKTLFMVMSLALGVAAAGPARAVPILLGTTNNATGITGLIVDGASYNVTFISDTYAHVRQQLGDFCS